MYELSTTGKPISVLHGLLAVKRKGLKKSYTILNSAISEWKWPTGEDTENESETMPSVIYDNAFDSDSSDDEMHITSI